MFLSIIPGVTTLRNICIGLCAAGVIGTGAGVYGYFKGKAKAEATAQAKANKLALDAEVTARIASENFRRQTQEMQTRVDAAERNYEKLKSQNASIVAAHRISDSKLRDQLSAYASGSSPSGESCAAERGRAETLGVLLAASVRLQTELAAGAETASDSVRALKEAWPSH